MPLALDTTVSLHSAGTSCGVLTQGFSPVADIYPYRALWRLRIRCRVSEQLKTHVLHDQIPQVRYAGVFG